MGKLLSLKHFLKSGTSLQAVWNAFTIAQHDRELRLRANLDALEQLQKSNAPQQ